MAEMLLVQVITKSQFRFTRFNPNSHQHNLRSLCGLNQPSPVVLLLCVNLLLMFVLLKMILIYFLFLKSNILDSGDLCENTGFCHSFVGAESLQCCGNSFTHQAALKVHETLLLVWPDTFTKIYFLKKHNLNLTLSKFISCNTSSDILYREVWLG